ncbi:MAG: hypothetical protein BMS9Abin07_1698 [Acidimicrobiia bacterium]|nr:MAG: hypothetical protein BMS9Abin07_1698 [Acidimicrobiia bacterium]
MTESSTAYHIDRATRGTSVPVSRDGRSPLARTFVIALLAVLFVALLQLPALQAHAAALETPSESVGVGSATPLALTQLPGEPGAEVAVDEPIFDVPVLPVFVSTAALLLVLSVLAVRREWVI